jgi:glucose-1-phosphate thymidylyltransferase
MNALILAAGYATRLYPLTLNKAKPLLEVAGKPIIEWVVDQLAAIPTLQSVYVVTNEKFAADFSAWTQTYRSKRNKPNFTVVNDGSTSDADKRGAIGDIHFVLRTRNIYNNDLLVVAGDNLFSQPLSDFAEFSEEHPATLGVYDVKSIDQAKKYNQLTTTPVGILTDFEEKPENPTSTICGIALYYYKPEALHLLDLYIQEGNNPDQPGRFVQWLHKKLDVFTFPIRGLWYDIGSHETLKEAEVLFGKL